MLECVAYGYIYLLCHKRDSFPLFLLASRTDISFHLHKTLQWILELIIGILYALPVCLSMKGLSAL